uniref:Midkine n=1 Tax=Sander lucioperca TaxID=283035 RepID=A0A8D0CZT8_SANLU
MHGTEHPIALFIQAISSGQSPADWLKLKLITKKNKPSQSGLECSDWRYGNCVPSNGDCGAGYREGSCDQQNQKLKCRVPCNWKKEFGADCKYRFGSWGECDPTSGLRTRTGTLKKALFNAECKPTISASKPCTGETKTKSKG